MKLKNTPKTKMSFHDLTALDVLNSDKKDFLYILHCLAISTLRDSCYKELPEGFRYAPDIYYFQDHIEYANTHNQNSIEHLNLLGVRRNKEHYQLLMPVIFDNLTNLNKICLPFKTFKLDSIGKYVDGNYVLSHIAYTKGQQGFMLDSPSNLDHIMTSLIGISKRKNLDPIPTDFITNVASMVSHFELTYSTLDLVEGGDYLSNLSKLDQNPAILYAVINLPDNVVNNKFLSGDNQNNLIYLYHWFISYYNNRYVKRKKGLPSYNPLENIVRDTDDLKPIVCSNKEGLATDSSGTIRYIPNITSLDSWNEFTKIQMMNCTFTNTYVEYCPIKVRYSGNDKLKLKNRYLYTDWRLNMQVYTSTSGTVHLEEMNGWKPTTVLDEITVLNQPLRSDIVSKLLLDLEILLKLNKKKILDFVDKSDLKPIVHIKAMESYNESDRINQAVFSTFLKNSDPNRSESATDLNLIKRVTVADFKSYIIDLVIFIYNTYSEDEVRKYFSNEFDYSIFSKQIILKQILDCPMLNCIKRASDFILETQDPIELLGLLGIDRGTMILGLLKTIGKHDSIPNLDSIELKIKSEYTDDYDKDYKPVPVPNILNHVYLDPHQVKVDSKIAKEFDHIIQAIQPGGGKTILGLIDAIRQFNNRERTLILCPNYLMKNYLEDGEYLAKGNVNFFCIDNDIYKRYGEDRLTKMILNAPRNTIFLAGFNSLSHGKRVKYTYLNQELNINLVMEFLRQFKWDKVIIDESHLLANDSSNRSKAVMKLLNGVPKIRLMTGTLINGSCVDAYGQAKFLKSIAFGSIENFMQKYALKTQARNKVLEWKPSAEKDINNHLRNYVNLNIIRSKEWHYRLPERIENFHFVSLTKNQHKVYNTILKEVIEEIEADAQLKGKLVNFDELGANELESYLQRYLARIEMFLGSPGHDVLGKKMLTDDDLISPKIHQVNKILLEHFSNPETKHRKVLIFSSYRNSALEIFNNLPKELKEMGLHYEAERKQELLPIMKGKISPYKIVVGVEQSLNTGHNFQDYGRLIAIESVWNPGTFEQRIRRVLRPDPKAKGTQGEVYFDWVCCDRTIDITKKARLISKMLSAVKFEENLNPLYDNLPELPVVSMTFENILENNSFKHSLAPYIDGYSKLLDIQKEEAKHYAKTNDFNPEPLPSSGNAQGSKFYEVPYIDGMVLPLQDELGLVNLNDYAMDIQLPVTKLDSEYLASKRVHTEYGDGIILSAAKTTIKVKLDSNITKTGISKFSSFLITKTHDKPIKKLMQDMIYST